MLHAKIFLGASALLQIVTVLPCVPPTSIILVTKSLDWIKHVSFPHAVCHPEFYALGILFGTVSITLPSVGNAQQRNLRKAVRVLRLLRTSSCTREVGSQRTVLRRSLFDIYNSRSDNQGRMEG